MTGPRPKHALRPVPGCPLSARELFVLELAADGHTAQSVGNVIGIKRSTVSRHMLTARIKLDADNTTQAVAIVIRNGWVL